MSKRLDSFALKFSDTDQTGFVRGRQTQHNSRCSLHIIYNVRETRTKAVIVSLYAKIGREYLFLVLERS